MQQIAWTSEYCAEWKISVSKGHIFWFHLYHIAELIELQRYRTDGWFPGARLVVEDYKKITQVGLCNARTIVYLECSGYYTNLHIW